MPAQALVISEALSRGSGRSTVGRTPPEWNTGVPPKTRQARKVWIRGWPAGAGGGGRKGASAWGMSAIFVLVLDFISFATPSSCCLVCILLPFHSLALTSSCYDFLLLFKIPRSTLCSLSCQRNCFCLCSLGQDSTCHFPGHPQLLPSSHSILSSSSTFAKFPKHALFFYRQLGNAMANKLTRVGNRLPNPRI